MIDRDDLFAHGVGDGELSRGVAVFVALPVVTNFVTAAFLDTNGEGCGSRGRRIAVSRTVEWFETIATAPVSGELGPGIIDDEPCELKAATAFLGVGAESAFGNGWNCEITVERGAAGAPRLFHQVNKSRQVVLIDSPGRGVTGGGDPGGLAHDLTHHSAGAHDPGGAEGATVDRDIAPGHEEVLDVPGIHDAVGDGVTVLAVDLAIVQ